MRIYQSCREMYSEVKRDLHEMGTIVHPQTMQDKDVANDAGFKTLELSPCDFTILDGRDRDDWLHALGKNLEWCVRDFNERTCALDDKEPVNPGEAYKMRPEWQEFIHDGRFAYTYSERFGWLLGHGRTAIGQVLNELKTNPDTRQAVLPIFSTHPDLIRIGGRARVPCSLHYQFLRREGELRMIYAMRSTDFITHFPYDIWMALEMQSLFAKKLGLPPGRFTFFTGSLHIYAKDADQGVF